MGLLAAAELVGGALAAGLVIARLAAPPTVLPWVLALIALPAYVLVGLHAAGAGRQHYAALVHAPGFLAAQLPAYSRILRGFDPRLWERTPRPGEAARRVPVGGVPIDDLRFEDAVATVVQAATTRPLSQICTVNLDFLASAREDTEVAAILRRSALNLADGAPVAWLGRLGGRRLTRIAGADLLPAVAAAGAGRGLRLFLLGGQAGTAADAARVLAAANPGLRVVGAMEPPFGSLEELSAEPILSAVNAARPDLLAVAFGHPKQEMWIARNGERLDVGAAIGVGCTFDLIAGRARRAPRWMQAAGLEWLFRLSQEPSRLFRRYLRDLVCLVGVLSRTEPSEIVPVAVHPARAKRTPG